MAGQRLARREPPESTMTALQRLTRETTIACALRLVLALSGGSESTSKSGAVHWLGVFAAFLGRGVA